MPTPENAYSSRYNDERKFGELRKSNSLSSNIFDIYDKELPDLKRDCFEKKYSFEGREYEIKSQTLFQEETWTIRELEFTKTSLNGVKDKLDDFDLREWHKHTNSLNPAGSVTRSIRDKIRAELVTQAWCKFYEIAYTYLLEPMKSINGNLFSVHLCEAPGAFVASLNHFVKGNFPHLKWNWLANSLNPFYEGNSLSSMINEDKLILHTLDNWDFGLNQTGDIFATDYILHLRRTLGERSCSMDDILIVTADGSFDCQNNPDKQELHVLPLVITEALTALSILATGGHFVLKTFTMFECNTVCLVYLLSCAFNKVNVFKPCTSKEGNSETYVVCTDYKGLESTKWVVDSLLYNIHQNSKILETNAIFSRQSIPEEFVENIKCCCSQFANLQMTVIERNIALFGSPNIINYRALSQVQNAIFNEYCERYDVRVLENKDRIVPNVEIESRVTIIEPRTAVVGSFSERKRKSLQGLQVRIEDIEKELESAIDVVNNRNSEPPNTLTNSDWSQYCCMLPIYGKSVRQVDSSQFCYSGFFRLKNELVAISPSAVAKYNDELSDYRQIIHKGYGRIVECSFHKLYTTLNNDDAQKLSLKRIIQVFAGSVRIGDSLVLIGLPLLTHFNVGLIYYLRGSFSEVTYSEPDKLVFDKCFKKLSLDMLNTILYFYNTVKPGFSILSFVETKYVRENKFYSWVVNVNNVSMTAQIRNMIGRIRSMQSDV